MTSGAGGGGENPEVSERVPERPPHRPRSYQVT